MTIFNRVCKCGAAMTAFAEKCEQVPSGTAVRFAHSLGTVTDWLSLGTDMCPGCHKAVKTRGLRHRDGWQEVGPLKLPDIMKGSGFVYANVELLAKLMGGKTRGTAKG